MTVPAHVLAAVRSIPHPRQETDMTAPFPSPAEQAVIDRFGIFEPEEDVERVARAMWEEAAGENPDAASWAEAADYVHDFYRQIAAVALAEMRPTAAEALVAVSRWINAGNEHRHPESVLWSRVLKVTEEAGEVFAALSGAIGENPRKGVTHTMADVEAELLDVASAALAAVEHIRGHDGQALSLLNDKILRVHARALAHPLTPVPRDADGGERR